MTHPRNMTAVEGQRVLFNCGAEAFPDNITYYWYKDRVDVRQLPVFNKRLTLSEGKLLLTGVVKEDMGWYTCRPSNGIGQDEASAYLNVTCELAGFGRRAVVFLLCIVCAWDGTSPRTKSNVESNVTGKSTSLYPSMLVSLVDSDRG